MKLSVIIPTYNRADRLKHTLLSIINAAPPATLELELILVDNNSTDETAQLFSDTMNSVSAFQVRYVLEPKQGRSYAVNTGIRAASGDLVTAVDDDEQLDRNWLREVERLFTQRGKEIDFAAGKILPIWEADPPTWIEPLKNVIVWRDYGDKEWIYTAESPIVIGGHGIFKKKVFEDVGYYNEVLGAKGKGFAGGEDEVFYDQLIRAGKVGIYSPDLVIYHHVPNYRLSKSYYRNWLFGVGVSRNLADMHYRPIEGVRFLGVPRWMYKSALAGLISKIRHGLRRDETASLQAENQPLVFVGFFYSRHVQFTHFDRIIRPLITRLLGRAER